MTTKYLAGAIVKLNEIQRAHLELDAWIEYRAAGIVINVRNTVTSKSRLAGLSYAQINAATTNIIVARLTAFVRILKNP